MNEALIVKANGILVSYEDAGKGNLPLIFVHAFPLSKAAWDAQFNELEKITRVIRYDIRGFGKSTANSTKATMALYADDLVAFMDELNIEQAVVCGLSMGGYIILNAVERYPDRFKAMVLCDTQCLADSKENQEKRYDTIKGIEEKAGLELFANDFVKNTLRPQTYETQAALVERVKNMILSNHPQAVTAALAAMAQREETCSKLKQLQIPALVLCGKEDTVTPPSLSEFLFNNLSGSQLHTIDKAGHFSNLEQPEAFNRYLRGFIGALA